MKPDYNRPSTWVPFRKGLCENCTAGCCSLPVEASAADLLRLELITEDEAAESLKKVATRLLKAGIIQGFQSKSQLFVIEQRRGRDCIFLDENRLCTVYEKRPEVCRKFPKIGPRPGFCPAGKKK
ncbi:MAG: YkgJ family cysteine cluster protein [Bdellovibrionota bacterium]|mgnify:CR=1 FL=1